MSQVEAILAQGNVLAQQGHFGEAADCYQQILAVLPAHAEANNNLGVMFAEQRRFAEALPSYQRALAVKADYAEAHYNLGNALKELRRLDEAVASYQRALAARPGFAGAHLNLGIALAYRGQPLEAIAEYQEALRLAPDWVEGHNNLGLALSHLGRHADALLQYADALRLRADFADAHYNRALSLLALGQLAEGWAEFEWRWRLGEIQPRAFLAPRWDGARLAGRTILLHSEQGLGDTIQFIRYAPLVRELGGTVVVECQSALLPLLAGCRGVDQWVGAGQPLPAFDMHFPLMSLGQVFSQAMTQIPASVPYLHADRARIERWRQLLNWPDTFRIGIAWQGSPGYRWDRLRSMPLECFAPLAAVPGVKLISLQKGPGTEQIATASFEVLDLGTTLDEDCGAFMDTAAVMHNLDLIITSDTAAAHLAGALGRPVWVALSFAPEWRWLLDRNDSPWYPTMRLFRQTRFGDWRGVFERMASELRSRTLLE